jgi:hypothetical protein
VFHPGYRSDPRLQLPQTGNRRTEVNLVRGLLPHLAPLAWGLVSTLLWQRSQSSAAWIPITVRGLLRDPKVRAELARIIADVARYANLTQEERRARALALARAALAARGIIVTDQELALLIELLYTWFKRTHPGAIAPEPVAVEGVRG